MGKLDLVLFDSCVQHILNILRVIRTPRGHCLLVDAGDLGKKSVRIAAYMAGCRLEILDANVSLDEQIKRIY